MNIHKAIDLLQDAINSHDARRVSGCFADDYRAAIPMHPSRSFTGSQHVLHNWTGLLARCPDLQATVLRSAINGEEIWSEWEMNGTATDATPILMRGIVVFTTHNEKIAWSRFYLDPVKDDAPGSP